MPGQGHGRASNSKLQNLCRFTAVSFRFCFCVNFSRLIFIISQTLTMTENESNINLQKLINELITPFLVGFAAH